MIKWLREQAFHLSLTLDTLFLLRSVRDEYKASVAPRDELQGGEGTCTTLSLL